MAFTSGFFDDSNGIGESELCTVLKMLVGNGINAGADGSMGFAVTVSGTKVYVDKGFGMVEGAWVINDAKMLYTPAVPSTYPIIYRVVLRRDFAAKATTAVLKAGTPASNPTAPALQQDDTCWELALAQVKVTPAGAVSMLSDERHTDTCGAYGNANNYGFRAFMEAIQTVWDAWFSGQQGLGFHHLYVAASQPSTLLPGDEWDEVTGDA